MEIASDMLLNGASAEAWLSVSTWWLLLPHLIGAAFSLHALERRHSAQGTIAWMLGLNLLPYLTIPLYLALGAERIRRHTGERLPEKSVTTILQGFQKHGTAPPLGTIGYTLLQASGIPPCTGNEVHILRDGLDTYSALRASLRKAKNSILIEFFIIRNDVVGERLRSILEEKARSGVQVHVIYDEIGSHKLPAGFLHSLKSAGVKIASFNGKRFLWSSFLRINYRNHRKLVIIDSKIAYLGSLNVGLEYIRRPGRLYWRDTFVRLSGPIVGQCLLSFAEDWQRAAQEDISHLVQLQEKCGQTTCQLIPSGPDDAGLSNWQLLLLEMASKAGKRLWLASPYFVPDAALYAALLAAARRGTDVRILVPMKGDNAAANLALLTYLPELEESGVQLLAYTPGFLHEKMVLADDSICSIGTANLDERSARLNFELTLLMEDRDMCRRVEKILKEDMEQSTPIGFRQWYHTPLYTRIAAGFCRLLSPIL